MFFELGNLGKGRLLRPVVCIFLTDEEVGGFGRGAVCLAVGEEEGVVGVDGVGDEGGVILAALDFADDGGELGEDDAVTVFLVGVVEAGDVHESGFIFEVEEYDSFAGRGGRHSEADGVADDEGFCAVGELAGFDGGDAAF